MRKPKQDKGQNDTRSTNTTQIERLGPH